MGTQIRRIRPDKEVIASVESLIDAIVFDMSDKEISVVHKALGEYCSVLAASSVGDLTTQNRVASYAYNRSCIHANTKRGY